MKVLIFILDKLITFDSNIFQLQIFAWNGNTRCTVVYSFLMLECRFRPGPCLFFITTLVVLLFFMFLVPHYKPFSLSEFCFLLLSIGVAGITHKLWQNKIWQENKLHCTNRVLIIVGGKSPTRQKKKNKTKLRLILQVIVVYSTSSWVLCILTSKWVLRMLFAGQNQI